MRLTLGFSTCPNDTFIFDAMVNGKIDTEGLEFDFFLTDVEELNHKAFNNETDITKISYHSYAYIADNYLLLNSGSALGYNNGPLLVSRGNISEGDIKDARIAIPGMNTTANLLLSIAFPGAVNKKEYLFSDIEDAVLSGEVDAGLLIHENRFTYEKKGLKKVIDFGEYWEEKMHSPIPLGGIAIKKSIPNGIARSVDRIIARSIGHAYDNPSSPYEFIRRYAVTMEREVMDKHIELYVNHFTRDLGREGKEAISNLFEAGRKAGILPALPENIFVS